MKGKNKTESPETHIGPFRIRVGKPISVKTVFADAETIRDALRWTERNIVNTKQSFLCQPYTVNSRFEKAIENLRKKLEKKYAAEPELLGSPENNTLLNGSMAYYASRTGCSELMNPEYIATLLMAASIYVLDYCDDDKERIGQILKILQEGQQLYESELEGDEEDIPFVLTSVYDSHYIRVAYQILKNRNRAILGRNKEEQNRRNNEFLNTVTAAETASSEKKVPGKERELFNRLMEIIPREKVEPVIKEMEEILDKRLDEMFLPLKEENRKILKKIADCNKFIEEQNTAITSYAEKIKNSKGMKKGSPVNFGAGPLLNLPDIEQRVQEIQRSVNSSPAWNTTDRVFMQSDIDVNQITAMVKRANTCYEEFWKLAVDRGVFMNSLVMVPDMQNFPGTYKKLTEKDLPGEDLILRDPFAMAFAMLWALENGHDLPWLGGFTDQLCFYIYHAVPWAEGISDQSLGNDETEESAESSETPRLTQQAMHRLLYRETGEDGEEKMTPAQLIYSDTAHMLPRNIHESDELYQKYLKLGISEIEAFYLACIAQIYRESDKMKEMLFDSLRKDTEGKDSKKEDVRGVKEALSAARRRNESLEEKLHASDKLLKEKQKEIEELKKINVTNRNELADLRELVFNENSQEPEQEPPEEKNENFPYTVRKQTLIFGGHKEWIKTITPLLKGNIRIYSDRATTNFDLNVLKNADVIWIQINAIAHSAYYRLINQAKIYNKQLRYFKTSSGQRAAEQLMMEDMKP